MLMVWVCRSCNSVLRACAAVQCNNNNNNNNNNRSPLVLSVATARYQRPPSALLLNSATYAAQTEPFCNAFALLIVSHCVSCDVHATDGIGSDNGPACSGCQVKVILFG